MDVDCIIADVHIFAQCEAVIQGLFDVQMNRSLVFVHVELMYRGYTLLGLKLRMS